MVCKYFKTYIRLKIVQRISAYFEFDDSNTFQKRQDRDMFTTVLYFFNQHSVNVWELRKPTALVLKGPFFSVLA